jgi:hypothetical protein
LCRDNRLFFAPLGAISAVHSAPATADLLGAEPAAAVATVAQAVRDAVVTPGWKVHAKTNYSVGSGPATAPLALALSRFADGPGTFRQDEPQSLLDATTELARVRSEYGVIASGKSKAQGSKGKPDDDANKAQQASRRAASRASTKRAAAGRLRRTAAQRNTGRAGRDWQTVEAMVACLEEFEAIQKLPEGSAAGPRLEAEDDGKVPSAKNVPSVSYELLQHGRVARDIHYDNELWMAIVLGLDSVIVRPPPLSRPQAAGLQRQRGSIARTSNSSNLASIRRTPARLDDWLLPATEPRCRCGSAACGLVPLRTVSHPAAMLALHARWSVCVLVSVHVCLTPTALASHAT